MHAGQFKFDQLVADENYETGTEDRQKRFVIDLFFKVSTRILIHQHRSLQALHTNKNTEELLFWCKII